MVENMKIHQMDIKTAFLNASLLKKRFTWSNPKDLYKKEANILCVSFTNPCMAYNNLQECGTKSSMHFLKTLDLYQVMWILLCILCNERLVEMKFDPYKMISDYCNNRFALQYVYIHNFYLDSKHT